MPEEMMRRGLLSTVCLTALALTSTLHAKDLEGPESWVGSHRDEIVGVLGQPAKAKRLADGSERLTFRLLTLGAGFMPSGDQRVVYLEGIGPCVTETAVADPTVRQTISIEPTSFDGKGRLVAGESSVSYSKSVSRKKGEAAPDDPSTDGTRAGKKVKLTLTLDPQGRMREWSVSPKKLAR